MPSPGQEQGSDSSILKELLFNQYQAIVLGGVVAVCLVSLSPLPLLVWLGGELALLPVLDSAPLRRLVRRRRHARLREEAEANRELILDSLDTPYSKRYAAMAHLCQLIEANYQGLHGISQVYLAEQRGKLDMILDSCVNRMLALQRYEQMLSRKTAASIEREIEALQQELEQAELPERARAALDKNVELKRRLLESHTEARGTMKALSTELDSMSSLLEVLHQNSISMRDPDAISQELDTIVRQSEDSERVVREMEALLRPGAADWSDEMPPASRIAEGGRGPLEPRNVRQQEKRR
jgi:DNA repair exonuclease SbcCD ATPase subunit